MNRAALILASGLILIPSCNPPNNSEPDWNSVNDFVYQLQEVELPAIGRTKFDLAVIDYSSDGSEEGEFIAEDIAALKQSPGGNKLVLAYLSIGEAEDYRWYWHEEWDADQDGTPDPSAPAWLAGGNPDWPGNYKVKYWDPAWQSIVYSYLDRVIEQGFDGIYLDLIDAYEYWGPDGESGLNRATAEQEMVDFVQGIASHARVNRARPGFGIFPQNGDALAAHSEYVDVIDGIGREDTWYDGDTPQAPGGTSSILSNLDVFRRAGKLVLVIDYVREPAHIEDFYSRARAEGYVPYATNRELDSLTINPGHEPD